MKKIIIIIDLIIILFTLAFILYYLYPLLIIMTGSLYCAEIFDMRKINIFGVLFVYLLIKSAIGIVYFSYLKIKYKLDFVIQNIKFIFPHILFSILILTPNSAQVR